MRVRHGRVPRRRWRVGVGTLAFAAPFSTFLVFAYSPFQDRVNGVPVPTRWANASVTWSLNATVGPNVDTISGTNPVRVETAVSNGFNTWQQPILVLDGQPVVLNSLNITEGPKSTLTDPRSGDCLNLISFSPSPRVEFSTATIAFTQVTTATPNPGQSPPFQYPCGVTSVFQSVIIDADMVFNPKELFSTSTPPFDEKHIDIQSIASHEFGHLLGLDHNGIAHAMMFPFGDTGASQPRDLTVDDVVGVAFLYPAPNFASSTGTVSGKITLGGAGIFASHVVVIDATTGAAVVDGLTNPDGTYRVKGVPPGTYNVLALPLSGVYTLENVSGWSCGYATDPDTCTGTPSNPTAYTGKFF